MRPDLDEREAQRRVRVACGLIRSAYRLHSLDPKERRSRPSGLTSLFPTLDRSDVAYDKLIELERVLIARTQAGRIQWERHDDEFSLATPSAVVSLAPVGVRLFNDSGVCLRQLRYATDALYRAASSWHERMRSETLDAILADLEALSHA